MNPILHYAVLEKQNTKPLMIRNYQICLHKMASLYNHYTETSSFLPSGASARLKEEKEQSIDVEKKIVQIWNETVQRNLAERPVTLIPKCLILIEKVFRPWFNADLDAWLRQGGIMSFFDGAKHSWV